MIRCDVCVIGGGPGGYAAALEAARRGAKVCLAERHHLGGTCLNVGCIPTKAMLAAGELFQRLSQGEQFGVLTERRWAIDRLTSHRDRIISQLRQAMALVLAQRQVRVVNGSAQFESPTAIRVGDEVIEAMRWIIATGSKPTRLPAGLVNGVPAMTSDDAALLQQAPGRLLIIGGGVIGCEFAAIYRALGSDVTIVEQRDRLLPDEDHDVARVLEQVMTQRGIHLVVGARVEQVRAGRATLSTKATVAVDAVLAAVGRQPNIEGLALERAGIEGPLEVDALLRTTQSHVFAVGDCNGRYQLAHVAAYEGEQAAANAVGQEPREPDYSSVPSCIYTDPEVASCGLTEEEARQQGEILVGRWFWKGAPRAMTLAAGEGLTKVIIDRRTRRLLGLHLVGMGASELIGQGVLAMRWGLTADQVAETIHAHPTLSETIREAILNAR